MKPSAARALLLEQHQRLRQLLAVAEELAEKVRAAAEVRSAFDAAVVALAQELLAHNRSEEELLEPLLAGVDDYSPQRISRMFKEHTDEHARLRATLGSSHLDGVAQAMVDLAEDLRAHMDAEERTFLHAHVLRDDRAKH